MFCSEAILSRRNFSYFADGQLDIPSLVADNVAAVPSPDEFKARVGCLAGRKHELRVELAARNLAHAANAGG